MSNPWTTGSANKTENYQLNQWVLEDKPRMSDFNYDNHQIDTALSQLQQQMSSFPANQVTYANLDMPEVETVEEALNTLSAEKVNTSDAMLTTKTETQTLSGPLEAGGLQALETAQVRNVVISAQDLQAGISPLPAGTLYLVYEAEEA